MAKYTVTVPCGPIWSNDDAKKKCPIVCASRFGKWTGQWTTVVEGQMSVCECELDTEHTGSDEFKTMLPAGPIWNNDQDAKEKGPIVAASYGGEWTGQWNTPVFGKMSVLEVLFKV